ncbi:MAG: hypothetical protein R3C30_04745 [Hyphomonadaceae bacterium]
MIARTLKIAAALTLLALPARADEVTTIQSEVASVIAAVHENAPYRSWDALRVAMPRSVRWHLAPPDRENVSAIRRSGWIEFEGRQAGIAVCGDADAPLTVTLRVDGATWRQVEQDPVIAALQHSIGAGVTYHEPTMVGEVERFQLGADSDRPEMLRVENCSREGSRARQRCDTTYILDVRAEDGAGRLPNCPAP